MSTQIKSKENTGALGDVYRYIYRSGTGSRQNIAEELGLSLPTVASKLKTLLEEGLVFNAGEYESTGGRKAYMFRCVPDARLAVGVDITQTHISYVLVDLELTILDYVKVRVQYENTDVYYEDIGYQIDAMLGRNQVVSGQMLGIGVSLPAIVGEGQNEIAYCKVIDLPDDFCERLGRHVSYPFLLFNDANSAGWTELWKREENSPMVYLSLSNSIGGALSLEKKRSIYIGDNWRGGEFGHMKIVPGGLRCYCGCRGCLDAYCSAQVLADFTDGDLNEFFYQLERGDNKGLWRVFRTYMEYLAMAVGNLRMAFDCDVVLGGSVGPKLETHLPLLRDLAKQQTPFEDHIDYIKICDYREEPSAVGAALYYVDEFIRGV